MLGLPGTARIFVCQEAVNMRKGFEGLSAEVERFFGNELTTGAYFVFINKSKDKMKVLYWDADGLAIWYKRLEKGRFIYSDKENMLINRREFFMLLEGVIPKKVQRRHKVF